MYAILVFLGWKSDSFANQLKRNSVYKNIVYLYTFMLLQEDEK